MKRITAKCKICDGIIFLSIDGAYPTEHDPMNLVPLATCNHCYDLRDRRMSLERSIRFACYARQLELVSKKPDVAKLDSIADGLKVLASKFGHWCSDLLRRQHSANAGYLADVLINQPDNWHRSLQDFENAARH